MSVCATSTPTRVAWLGWLMLSACTEYGLGGKIDPKGATETGTTEEETTPPECGALDIEPVDAAVDESCAFVPPTGTFTPVVEWRDASIGGAYTSPVVGQLTDDNGDGVIGEGDVPDIVVGSTIGDMAAFSGDGSGRHWWITGLGAEPSTAAIGDLNGDGAPDVAVAGASMIMAVDGATGVSLWRRDDPALSISPVCGGVGIYDLDLDGAAEVVLGSLILEGATGNVRGIGAYGKGTGHSFGYAAFGVAADIDADGDLEVVVGNAVYDENGGTVWTNGQPDGFVAVANFDDDLQGEIVVSWYPGSVRLQDDDGSILWQTASLTGTTIGPPTVADFDGDGEPEIGVAGNNIYVVLETDGTQKWSRAVVDYSSGFTGSSVFDFEGDGSAEVVYADEQDVWVFDGATGAVKMQQTEHSSATCSEYPTIADVDNDGHAEIIYTSSPYGAGAESGVRVIGDLDNSWMPGRTIWNQHAYAITHIDDNGVCPTDPDSNWPTFNSFRSGDMTPLTGSNAADAVPMSGEICLTECEEDRVSLVVYVGNGGTSDLPADVSAALYTRIDGELVSLGTVTTPDALRSGASIGFEYTLDLDDIGEGVWFTVDDDGTGIGRIGECSEDNNTLRLLDPEDEWCR